MARIDFCNHSCFEAQIDGKTAFVFAGGGSLGAIQIGMLAEVERYTRAAEQERLARQAIKRQARNKNKSGKPYR
jgi:predicted acylesterase/phospholipase RssA